MRRIIIRWPFLLLCIVGLIHAQDSTQMRAGFLSFPDRNEGVYRWHPWTEIPATAALFALNAYGLQKIQDKPVFTEARAAVLDPSEVNAFDRRAIFQNIDRREARELTSNTLMRISYFSPAILFIDRRIRRDWLKVTTLYLESQAIGGNLYVWAGANLVDRPRPRVYNTDLPIWLRIGDGTLNSFYSGHVASSGTATYFVAKVFCDYHPEWGFWERAGVYAAATALPGIIAVQRYQSMKHYPSDLLVGFAAAVGVGVLVPELHRNRGSKAIDWSVRPFAGPWNGLAFDVRF